MRLNDEERIMYRLMLEERVSWLSKPIALFDSVDWYWKDWGEDSARMALYVPPEGRVYLNKRCGELLPRMLMPTIVHELRHRWQHGTYGIWFGLLAIPFIRELTIERVAKQLEKEADEIWG